jgi:DNA repair photolyase
MENIKKHGTQDWADITVNCCTGCSHDCVYCYAKGMAYRFRQVSPGQWPTERIRPQDVGRSHRRYPGTVMFPSSHDITPATLQACLQVLGNLLKAGNRVLVVSKPHLDCIQAVCRDLASYRDQILFRFTIGASDGAVLSFWEPGAPTYAERVACLQYAHEEGFETSVSIEPMLVSAHIDALVADVMPHVTETIWIGKMNHLGRLAKNASPQLLTAIQGIEAGQTDAIIRAIHARHQANPAIRWKDSIRKVVG